MTSNLKKIRDETGITSETDPIYTADQPNIIFIGDNVSALVNDAGYLTSFTETDPIYTADKPSIIFSGENISQLTNDSGYLTSAITSLNSLTASSQTFATGTSGTDFAISSSVSTHTFNLPTASATNRGALSSADWTTFNNKQNTITNPVTGTGTANRVAYWSSSSAITSNAGLTYDPTSTAEFFITSQGATHVPQTIKMASSQSANSWELQDSTGAIKGRWDKSGKLSVGHGNAFANGHMLDVRNTSASFESGRACIALVGTNSSGAYFQFLSGESSAFGAGTYFELVRYASSYSTASLRNQLWIHNSNNPIIFTTDSGGTTENNLSLYTTYAVFNETGADIDFRIEGDTDANLFVCDAGADKVSIGSATVNAKFNVLSTTEQIRVLYNSTNYLSETIDSSGNATFALTGTSPKFTFSQAVKISTLTSGRVLFATTSGEIVDDADLTFSTDTLTATKIIGSTSIKAGSAGGYLSSDGSAGATGSFTTVDLKTVTVKDGIITAIV